MRVVIDALTIPSVIMSMGILLFFGMLFFFRKAFRKTNRLWRIWRGLCFVPLAACVIHGLIYNFGAQWLMSLTCFGPMYAAAVLIGLWQFTGNKTILRRIIAGVTGALCLFNAVYITAGVPLPPNLHCYTYQSWTDSFIRTLRTMEKEYPLAQWKGIDYDALQEEFVPRIQEAERNQDTVALGIALYDYCNRFYDGHISIDYADFEVCQKINRELIGNDYGLSLITLDNGKVVAIAVEPDVEALGVHSGTVITQWDGVRIEEAKEGYRLPMTPPVAENEEPSRTMLLAGTGSDSVSVSFMEDNGEEKTVTLNRIGDYVTRYTDTYSRFCHISAPDENFSYKMISDSCGYLRIHSESLGAFASIYTAFTSEAPFITKQVDEILTELTAQGMTQLVIDIRNNTGGNPAVSAAVASLFSENDQVYCWEYSTVDSNGLVSNGIPQYVRGNGKWEDLPVAVLVNQNTVSAGDCMAYLLSSYPNVTLMGMTPSNCSYQTTGGECYLAEGHFNIRYPITFCTDKDGKPMIDTGLDRECRIPLEVQIPLNETAIEAIFGEAQKDYELEYAVDWLLRLVSTN